MKEPVTKNLEFAADVFNRLEWLESERHRDGHHCYSEETLWGLLTAMGFAVDDSDVENFCHKYGMSAVGFRVLAACDIERLIRSKVGAA